jgi:hypothetical protein
MERDRVASKMGDYKAVRSGHWVAVWAAMPSLSEDDLPAAFVREQVRIQTSMNTRAVV